MIDCARNAAPDEACGLLVGPTAGRVSNVHCLSNVEDGDPRVRYVIDAGEQFRVMREAEESGLEVVGAFHSHVTSPARPSATDIELAGYPEWAWVIVSLAASSPVIKAFSIVDGKVDQIAIDTPSET